jgi:hypothetical protein
MVVSLSGIRARLGKGWKAWGNPYSGTSMVVSRPVLPCGYNLYTSIECWKLEVPRDRTFWLFLLSIPMVELIMKLDDDMRTVVDHLYCYHEPIIANIPNNEFIACHLRSAIAFLQMYKCLMIPLHPPNIHMFELSPASTKCTHGVVVKLFCR